MGVARGRLCLRGFPGQVPSQRKQGRCSDSSNEKLGESPHYNPKNSLFKSHFKVTPCMFRGLTLYKGELVQYLLDRGITI